MGEDRGIGGWEGRCKPAAPNSFFALPATRCNPRLPSGSYSMSRDYQSNRERIGRGIPGQETTVGFVYNLRKELFIYKLSVSISLCLFLCVFVCPFGVVGIKFHNKHSRDSHPRRREFGAFSFSVS